MNKIKEVMKKQKITQAELAEETGIQQSEISKIVRGKEVTLSTAKKIARALGHSIEYLWPDDF